MERSHTAKLTLSDLLGANAACVGPDHIQSHDASLFALPAGVLSFVHLLGDQPTIRGVAKPRPNCSAISAYQGKRSAWLERVAAHHTLS